MGRAPRSCCHGKAARRCEPERGPCPRVRIRRPAEVRRILASRKIERVVILGANGSMGYGSGRTVHPGRYPDVSFLARTRAKGRRGSGRGDRAGALAHGGLARRGWRLRGGSRARGRARRSDLRGIDRGTSPSRRRCFDRVGEDPPRRRRSSRRSPRACRSTSWQRGATIHFAVTSWACTSSIRPTSSSATELVAGRDTDRRSCSISSSCSEESASVARWFAPADSPAFAGNRVGFKVLNEAVQLAQELGPLLVDRIVGPYTGRAMAPPGDGRPGRLGCPPRDRRQQFTRA